MHKANRSRPEGAQYTSKKMSFLFPPMRKSSSLSTTSFTVLLLFGLSFASFSSTEAYDALDPTGSIRIKWDIMNWTADGYVAAVTIYNYQIYRHFQAPGWSLGWTWTKGEVILSMLGAKATEKGNCSRSKGTSPRSCKKNPTIVDEMPSVPYNERIPNCCKGGVLGSLVHDRANSIAAFQLTVGAAGTNNRTVRLPKNFTLSTPGPGYSCGRAIIIRPTRFISPDKRRMTQAFMTWNVTCTYSQFLVQNVPTCCVSLSSFDSNTSVPCSACSCGCRNNTSKCVEPHSSSGFPASESYAPLVQCTSHMCPIHISWQVTEDHIKYWLVKLKITNFNYRMNYSDWNLVIQHPDFDNLTRIVRFNYKTLTPYAGINDTAMLWGVKFYNNILMQAGPLATVESELHFKKHDTNSSSSKGWAFPQRVIFNGDNCIMPTPDAYTLLPN